METFILPTAKAPGAIIELRCSIDSGQFLRQWELHRTDAEAGDVQIVHCVALDVDGHVYACDRRSHQDPGSSTRWVISNENMPIKFEERNAALRGSGA